LVVCGFCLGWEQTLSLVLGAMIMFLIVGVMSIVYRNKSRNTVMAYLPFLWAIFMISLII